jgi:type I restriction enzyme, S subunit
MPQAMSELAYKNGWACVAFGDVVQLSRERSADPKADGLDRYVGLEHIDPGDLKIRHWGAVDGGTTFTNVFRTGQVLFGKRRAYLRKVAVADFDGVCSSDIYVLQSKSPELLTELLPFICQTDGFSQHAVRTSAGSLSPRTNWHSLASYTFALPPLDEQRRIEAALSAGQRLSGALIHLLSVVSTTIESLVISYQRSVAIERTGTLGDVVARLESGTSPGGIGRKAHDNEYGVLKVSAVGDWSFDEDEHKVIPSEAFEKRYEVRPGDLLVTRANADPDSVGRTCLVEACRSGLMISDKTWRLVLKPDVGLDPVGLLAWTKSPAFRRHVLKQLGGTEAKNISKARFLSGPLPSEDVVGFNAFGSKIRTLLDAQRQTKRHLAAITTMSRDFAGRMLE